MEKRRDYTVKPHKVRPGHTRGPQRGRLHLHNMVTLFLYGSPHCFKTRNEAAAWLMSAMSACDTGSSEFSRYADVLLQVQTNPDQHTFRDCDGYSAGSS